MHKKSFVNKLKDKSFKELIRKSSNFSKSNGALSWKIYHINYKQTKYIRCVLTSINGQNERIRVQK